MSTWFADFSTLYRSPLCRHVTVAVFLSIVVIEVAILVPSYFTQEARLLADLEKRAQTILISTHAGDALSMDARMAEATAARILAHPKVKGVAIHAPTGSLLAEAGEPVGAIRTDDNKPAAAPGTPANGGRHGVYWRPGTLFPNYGVALSLDREGVASDLRYFVARIVGLVILIAVFVTLTTMAVLGRRLIFPMLRLRDRLVIERDTAVAFEVPVVNQSDELGDIIRKFNDVLAELHGMRRGLEERVEQRTADLAQSEARFRDFAASASDWFWEMDEKLRFSYFSERFEQVTGVEPKKLIGKTRQETGIPGVEPASWERHLAELAAHRPFRGFVHPRVRPDGQVVHLSISGTPVFDEAGTFKGYRGSGTDITERIRAEATLRQAMAQAEAANHSKSEFLANMSHELRTPLNAIIGYSETMYEQLLGPLGNASYRDYARNIHESGALLLSLIDDILDLSKIEAGKLELIDEEVDVAEMLAACLRIVGGRAKDAGLVLDTRLISNLPLLRVDGRTFKQMILNLLSNAIKFTPSGGRITVKAGVDEAGDLLLAVEDTGIGIAADDIPKALDAFGQVASSLTREHHGTGLGLPLVKSLVEAHDGTLTLESTPDAGTVVTLRFPAERVIPARGAETGAA